VKFRSKSANRKAFNYHIANNILEHISFHIEIKKVRVRLKINHKIHKPKEIQKSEIKNESLHTTLRSAK